MENVNFVDVKETTIPADGRRSYNQIRAKETSHENMSKKYIDFLEETLKKMYEEQNNKLQEAKEEFASGVSLDEGSHSKLNELLEKATAVARTEEYINILINEIEKSQFVSNRAIKLVSTMIENFINNSNMAIEIEKAKLEENQLKNDISAESMEIPTESPETYEVSENVGIPVVDDSNIPAIDNQESQLVENENVSESVVDNINVVEPISIPDRGFEPETSEMQSVAPEVDVEPKDDNTFISTDEIDSVLTDFMNNSKVEPEVDSEDETKEETVVEDAAVKASQNENREVKVDKFVAGNRYSYQPLTDEEINEARQKLNFDLPEVDQVVAGGDVENVPSQENIAREEPVIAPDRKEENVITEKVDFDENLKFDYSEVTKNDVENIILESTSKDQLRELISAIREREAKLQSVLDDSKKKEETLENVSKEAEAAKKERTESETTRNDMMAKLRTRDEDLSKEIENASQSLESINNSISEKERFISEQRKETEENNQLIEEIRAILSEENSKTR